MVSKVSALSIIIFTYYEQQLHLTKLHCSMFQNRLTLNYKPWGRSLGDWAQEMLIVFRYFCLLWQSHHRLCWSQEGEEKAVNQPRQGQWRDWRHQQEEKTQDSRGRRTADGGREGHDGKWRERKGETGNENQRGGARGWRARRSR